MNYKVPYTPYRYEYYYIPISNVHQKYMHRKFKKIYPAKTYSIARLMNEVVGHGSFSYR